MSALSPANVTVNAVQASTADRSSDSSRCNHSWRSRDHRVGSRPAHEPALTARQRSLRPLASTCTSSKPAARRCSGNVCRCTGLQISRKCKRRNRIDAALSLPANTPPEPQHAKRLGEQLILQCRAVGTWCSIVKHTTDAELARSASRCRAVASDDPGSVAVLALQPIRHRLVDLDRGVMRRSVDQHPDVGAVARPDFQHVVAEVDVREHPRQQAIFDRRRSSGVSCRKRDGRGSSPWTETLAQ